MKINTVLEGDSGEGCMPPRAMVSSTVLFQETRSRLHTVQYLGSEEMRVLFLPT